MAVEPDIAAEAAAWLARQDRGLTPAETRALAAWLAADRQHAAEWTRIGAFWTLADGARAVPELAAWAAELEARIKTAIEGRHLPEQDARVAAPAIVGALMEGLLGPLAPSPARDLSASWYGRRASRQSASVK